MVGTGGRGLSFVEPLATTYRDTNELVALCDPSPSRLRYYNELITNRWGAPAVAEYDAGRFDHLIAERRADLVVVCTPDDTHHDYIARALDGGADVICEKPMTIDADRCRHIFDAVARSGRPVRVAFNYRWGRFRTKVKELIATGTIGRVRSVNLEYLLDTSHGADYFRRWHARRAASGGLFVHKSTHHFDLVNWWLDAIPLQVFAHGDLVFYGAKNADARGDRALADYDRYTGVSRAERDPFRLDLSGTESFRRLYLEAEAETGYVRDRNVFRPDIDIFDQMSALVRYRTGEVLTYSLVAYSPREGMRVTFNGDRGRIEYNEFVGSHMNRAVPGSEFAAEEHGSAEIEGEWITVFPHFKPSHRVDLPPGTGAHGGADAEMNHHLFDPSAEPDRWHRSAGHEQGAASILVGIAANQSADTGRPVNILDLFPLAPDETKLSHLDALLP